LIVGEVFRICSMPTNGFSIGFNQFLVDDEKPTQLNRESYESYDAVQATMAEVFDPTRLISVVFGHFESDECGGMNLFLTEIRVGYSD
jgi:flavorubredoxin